MPLVLVAPKVLRVCPVGLADLDLRDLLVHPVQMVVLVLLVRLVLTGRLVLPVTQVFPDRLVRQELSAKLGTLDRQGTRVRLDLWAERVYRGLLGTLGQQVFLVIPDLQASRDHWVLLVRMVRRG